MQILYADDKQLHHPPPCGGIITITMIIVTMACCVDDDSCLWKIKGYYNKSRFIINDKPHRSGENFIALKMVVSKLTANSAIRAIPFLHSRAPLDA